MKATVEDIVPAVLPGMFAARFEGVEEKTNETGTFWLWSFSLAVPSTHIGDVAQYGEDDTVIPITATSSPRITPRTKAAKWLAGLGVNVEVGDEIDFDALKETRCMVTIILSETGYSRIDAVLPMPQGKAE